MTRKEIDRLSVIQQIESKQISQMEGAAQLKLTTRQVRRLQRSYEKDGAAGIVSKRRGQTSSRRLDERLTKQVINLIKENYRDFGPTLAHEKLTEKHGLVLSVESTRQLMLKEGLWQGKKRRSAAYHPQRARRACFGELVQIDGSPHDWFEARGPRCCLLVFIDDATSKIVGLHFTEVESTQAYFDAARTHIERYGRPLAYYSDKHSIFRVNIAEAASGNGETQFSRAMRELGIELICAHSPQAKGRVEKANATLQDRLVKEMRLRQINTIEAANAFVDEFIEDYNKRFAVAPANKNDAHRKTLPDEQTLDFIFSHQHERTISKNLEVSYQNVIYQIQSRKPAYNMRKAKLTILDRQDQITLLYKGKSLPYKILDKRNPPTKIVTSKQLAGCRKNRPAKPAADHPWRHYGKLKMTRTPSHATAS